jgi:DNA-binding SARP family transcriptional activator/predicted negative regulator of RcsB-dependent stress response
MLVRALGPVELRAGGKVVGPGGPKAKALLAALTIHVRQVVSIDRLVDLVWDERPPSSASALVHQYVSQIRRSFAAADAKDVLTTRAPGYLLQLDADQLDIEVFAGLTRAAADAEQAGDPARALDAYRSALALWRGPAFGGVDARFARDRATGLEAERLTAEEGLARCLLGLGHTAEATSRFTTLTAAHPLREESRGLLMRALHAAGRPADAMTVYHDGRARLVDQLGVEPSAALQDLYGQILDGTLTTAGHVTAGHVTARPAPVATRQDPARVVPHQLPPGLADFTGRTDQVATILAIARSGRATPTVVVSGSGGSGKSALATHCAHLLAVEYPDGQLFADLQAATDDGSVLGRFLRALGVAGVDLPDDVDERAELFRMAVADRRLVIVLDNARGERQVRRLLPGSGACLVLITSRSRLTGLAGTEPLELDYLTPAQSVEMLGRIIGPGRVAGDPAAAARIAELCAGVPLAVRVAGAKLLARAHWPLRTLATRLSDERRRLDELVVGDLAIRSSLELNHNELTGVPRRAFHLLALLGPPDFGAWLAAPLLEVSLDDAEDVVEQLVELRLVEVAGIDTLGRVRYRLHDLVRLFGAEQAARHESADAVSAAVGRTLDVWTALVETGAARLPRVTLGLRPSPGPTVEVDPRLAEEVTQAPTDWLAAETGALVRIIERAHELGIDELSTTLITSLLSSPFAARNEFDGWQRTHEVALAAARRAGDRRATAALLAGLGQLHYEKDDFAAAFDHFQLALDEARAIGDDAVRAVALVGVATVQRDRAEFAEATANLTAAAELAGRTGDRSVLAAASYGLGALQRDHGDLDQATAALTECVGLYRAVGDRRGEALALRGLSLCRRAAGDYDEAAARSRDARHILADAGDLLGATYAAQSLAKAELRAGRTAGVRTALEQCEQVCARHQDRFGVALVTRTLGELALATGDLDEAAASLAKALAMWTELGLPLWQARTLRDLAAATDDATRWDQAMALFAQTDAREAAELAGLTHRDWSARVSHRPIAGT